MIGGIGWLNAMLEPSGTSPVRAPLSVTVVATLFTVVPPAMFGEPVTDMPVLTTNPLVDVKVSVVPLGVSAVVVAVIGGLVPPNVMTVSGGTSPVTGR